MCKIAENLHSSGQHAFLGSFFLGFGGYLYRKDFHSGTQSAIQVPMKCKKKKWGGFSFTGVQKVDASQIFFLAFLVLFFVAPFPC